MTFEEVHQKLVKYCSQIMKKKNSGDAKNTANHHNCSSIKVQANRNWNHVSDEAFYNAYISLWGRCCRRTHRFTAAFSCMLLADRILFTQLGFLACTAPVSMGRSRFIRSHSVSLPLSLFLAAHCRRWFFRGNMLLLSGKRYLVGRFGFRARNQRWII